MSKKFFFILIVLVIMNIIISIYNCITIAIYTYGWNYALCAWISSTCGWVSSLLGWVMYYKYKGYKS